MDWTVSEPMLLPLMNCEADFVLWAQSVSQKTLRTEAFRKTRNNRGEQRTGGTPAFFDSLCHLARQY